MTDQRIPNQITVETNDRDVIPTLIFDPDTSLTVSCCYLVSYKDLDDLDDKLAILQEQKDHEHELPPISNDNLVQQIVLADGMNDVSTVSAPCEPIDEGRDDTHNPSSSCQNATTSPPVTTPRKRRNRMRRLYSKFISPASSKKCTHSPTRKKKRVHFLPGAE